MYVITEKDEFSYVCSMFYTYKQRYMKCRARFEELIKYEPQYNGETKVSDIDDKIKYIRRVQKLEEKKWDLIDDLIFLEQDILMYMDHFEIPRNTRLTGVIPDELEYEIWADDRDVVHVEKTRDYIEEPEELPPGVSEIIRIKFSKTTDELEEEEDEDADCDE
jgi:hypothetical protein